MSTIQTDWSAAGKSLLKIAGNVANLSNFRKAFTQFTAALAALVAAEATVIATPAFAMATGTSVEIAEAHNVLPASVGIKEPGRDDTWHKNKVTGQQLSSVKPTLES